MFQKVFEALQNNQFLEAESLLKELSIASPSNPDVLHLMGVVCGMQSKTNALHLGFDMHNASHNVNGKTIKVNNQPFLHVGHCIHVDIIKTFLTQNGIKFYEA